jgi:hypothetical protein
MIWISDLAAPFSATSQAIVAKTTAPKPQETHTPLSSPSQMGAVPISELYAARVDSFPQIVRSIKGSPYRDPSLWVMCCRPSALVPFS